jgi:hypothetical protein
MAGQHDPIMTIRRIETGQSRSINYLIWLTYSKFIFWHIVGPPDLYYEHFILAWLSPLHHRVQESRAWGVDAC